MIDVTQNASPYNAMYVTLVGRSLKFLSLQAFVSSYLTKNLPEGLVTNGQKLYTEFIYIVLQISVQRF